MWPQTSFRKTDASRWYSPEHAGFLVPGLDQVKCSGEEPPTEPVARLQQLEVDTDTMKESLRGRPGEAASDDQHTRMIGAVFRASCRLFALSSRRTEGSRPREAFAALTRHNIPPFVSMTGQSI
jgi:hypothetical protein